MAPQVDLSKPYLRVWVYALALHAALFSIFFGPDGTGVLFIVIGGGVIFALLRMYHDEKSLILFVVQVLYGHVFVGFLGTLLSELYDAHIERGSPLRSFDAIPFAIAGLLAGWCNLRLKPSLLATAKWIWILPVPLFTYSFLHDWLWPWKSCIDAMTLYFIPSGADEGLTTGFVTWPAFSLSGYSIGSWIASRIRVQPHPPALL